MPDGHLGRFLEVNDTTCKLLHYNREEILQMSVKDAMNAFAIDEMERLRFDLEKNIQEQKPVTFETLFVGKDGIKIPVEVNQITSNYKGQKATLVIARDITERKLAETALKEANRKLVLLSSITRHDILNQVTILMGYQNLSESLISDTQLKEYLVKQKHATDTIRQLISFTKDYEDIGAQSPRWQELKLVISKACENLGPTQATISIDLATVEIYADPLLEKVFYNLIENALQHGEKVTHISFSWKKTDGGLTVVCEDDGIGIPPDAKENIFSRRFFKHTGFGLSLSRDILAITGLIITEIGEFGKGARFEILIPAGSYRCTGNA